MNKINDNISRLYHSEAETKFMLVAMYINKTIAPLIESNAVLLGELKGAQCSEPLKSRPFSKRFVQKKYDFLVAQDQKLGAKGPWALLQSLRAFLVIT